MILCTTRAKNQIYCSQRSYITRRDYTNTLPLNHSNTCGHHYSAGSRRQSHLPVLSTLEAPDIRLILHNVGEQNYSRTGQDRRRYTESTSQPRGFDGRSHGYGDECGSSTPYEARTFTSDPMGPIPELRESHVRHRERSSSQRTRRFQNTQPSYYAESLYDSSKPEQEELSDDQADRQRRNASSFISTDPSARITERNDAPLQPSSLRFSETLSNILAYDGSEGCCLEMDNAIAEFRASQLNP